MLLTWLIYGLRACSGGVKGQVAHTLGAWILAKALLDTHAPLALSTPIMAAAAALRFSADSDDEDEAEYEQELRGNDDAILIDTAFLAKRNLDKDIAAAADEALIRVLESGPNSLEAVKEAAGALKALIAGLVNMHQPASYLVCSITPCKINPMFSVCDRV